MSPGKLLAVLACGLVLSLIQRTYQGAARIRAMSIYSAVLTGGGVVGQVVTMTVFGSYFFAFALHLQGGLGESALRAGLAFAPAAAAFAVVNLNWWRLTGQLHGGR